MEYTKNSLLKDSKVVMHDWEHPMMKKHAEVVTKKGGDILELGFGMGISANYIQEQDIKSHTIIEEDKVVYQRLLEWAKDKPNVIPIFGDWKSNLPNKKFDGILKDTYGDNVGALMFPIFILKVSKVGTIISFFNDYLKPKTIYQGVAEKYPHYLADSNMDFHEVEIDKPEFVDYLTGDENYYVPEWVVSESDTEERFREKLRSRDE